jgi:hypothetical protein
VAGEHEPTPFGPDLETSGERTGDSSGAPLACRPEFYVVVREQRGIEDGGRAGAGEEARPERTPTA